MDSKLLNHAMNKDGPADVPEHIEPEAPPQKLQSRIKEVVKIPENRIEDLKFSCK